MQAIRIRPLWAIALAAALIAVVLIRSGMAANVQAAPKASSLDSLEFALVSQEVTTTATEIGVSTTTTLEAGALLGSPPLIDGIEGETEWAAAVGLSFPSENLGFVFLQAMIDQATLYLAVRVADTALSPGDFAGFVFDNSGNGVTDDRDDTKGRFVPEGYRDMHRFLGNWRADDVMQHGEAAVRHDPVITHANGVGESNYFEFAFPLLTGDPFDYQTWPGGELVMCVMVVIDAKVLEQHPVDCIGESQEGYMLLGLPDLGLPTPTPTPTITPKPGSAGISTATPTSTAVATATPTATSAPTQAPPRAPSPTPNPTSTSVAKVPTPTAAPTPAAPKTPTAIIEATPVEVELSDPASELSDPGTQSKREDEDSGDRTQILLGVIGAIALLAGYALVRSRLKA